MLNGQRLFKCLPLFALLCLWGVLISACSPSPPSSETEQTAPDTTIYEPIPAGPKLDLKVWQLTEKRLNQSVHTVHTFSDTINTFLARPTAANLEAAQQQWRECQLQLEPLQLILQLGLQKPQSLAQLFEAQQSLLSWPTEPGVLDRFGPYEFSGVVFDISVELNEQQLRNMHLQMGASEAFSGLYPLHYLLFGLNNSQTSEAFAPNTSMTKAEKEQGYKTLEELPNNRRRRLLTAMVALLVRDTQNLHSFWRLDTTQETLNTITIDQMRTTQVGLWAQHITFLAELTAAPEDSFGLGYDQLEQLVQQAALRAKALEELVPYLALKEPDTVNQLIKNLISLSQQPEKTSSSGESSTTEAPNASGELAKALYQPMSLLARQLQNGE